MPKVEFPPELEELDSLEVQDSQEEPVSLEELDSPEVQDSPEPLDKEDHQAQVSMKWIDQE